MTATQSTSLVTLSDLCSRYKRDPARARHQLRKAGLRPRTGRLAYGVIKIQAIAPNSHSFNLLTS